MLKFHILKTKSNNNSNKTNKDGQQVGKMDYKRKQINLTVGYNLFHLPSFVISILLGTSSGLSQITELSFETGLVPLLLVDLEPCGALKF